MSEIWLQCNENGNYWVSNHGRVWSSNVKRLMKQHPSGSRGDLSVPFCANGRVYKDLVSRIVAKAFCPNPDNNPFVDHIDGNWLNNRADNLRWCTRSENMANRKSKHRGVTKRGNGYICRLSHGNVEIRKRFKTLIEACSHRIAAEIVYQGEFRYIK